MSIKSSLCNEYDLKKQKKHVLWAQRGFQNHYQTFHDRCPKKIGPLESSEKIRLVHPDMSGKYGTGLNLVTPYVVIGITMYRDARWWGPKLEIYCYTLNDHFLIWYANFLWWKQKMQFLHLFFQQCQIVVPDNANTRQKWLPRFTSCICLYISFVHISTLLAMRKKSWNKILLWILLVIQTSWKSCWGPWLQANPPNPRQSWIHKQNFQDGGCWAARRRGAENTPAPKFSSLWPSDAIWRHWFGSTLAQVMACCLTAPRQITLTNVDLSSGRSSNNHTADEFARDTSLK